jgi:hypothetical protein
MATEPTTSSDWHRLFGRLLTGLFKGSPFAVELKRELSVEQTFCHVVIPDPGPQRASIVRRMVPHVLDAVIVRRGPGRFAGRLPDGLDGLVAHNLFTLRSHKEWLDAWGVKELVAQYVAYRKVVSPSPRELLPEDQFRLFAVCAIGPRKLRRQVPWRQPEPGVYDYRWGPDTVRVVVASEVSRLPHNALWHRLNPCGMYGREETDVGYAIPEFRRDFIKEHWPELSPEDRQDVLRSLPAEELLAVVPLEEIRRYLDRATAGQKAPSHKPRRQK